MERLLAPSDASHILGVVPATVRAMAIDGRLRPVAITEGGIRLFRREDVERLAAERAARARAIARLEPAVPDMVSEKVATA